MQLIVLGMHRSGTSAATRLLNLMGAYVGAEEELWGGNVENPKGFWERRDVQLLNQRVLEDAGADWFKVRRFSLDRLTPAQRESFTQSARAILETLEPHRPWAIKDPRLCLVLPLWRDLLTAPVCIVVYRNPLEVADSLRTRNGFSRPFGLALWEAYVVASLTVSHDLPRVFLSYNRLLQDPLRELEALKSGLEGHGVSGLALPEQSEIDAFLDAANYRERESVDAFQDSASGRQMRLYQALEAGAPQAQDTPPALSGGAVETLELQEALFDQEAKLKAAEAALVERSDQIRRNTESLESLRTESEALREQNAQLRSESEARRSEIEAVRREVSETRQRFERMQSELEQHRAREAQLEARLDESRRDLDRAKSERRDLDREYGRLRTEMLQHKAEVERIRTEARRRAELESLQRNNDRLRTQFFTLYEIVAGNRRDGIRLTGWIETLDRDVHGLAIAKRGKIGRVLAPFSGYTRAVGMAEAVRENAHEAVNAWKSRRLPGYDTLFRSIPDKASFADADSIEAARATAALLSRYLPRLRTAAESSNEDVQLLSEHAERLAEAATVILRTAAWRAGEAIIGGLRRAAGSTEKAVHWAPAEIHAVRKELERVRPGMEVRFSRSALLSAGQMKSAAGPATEGSEKTVTRPMAVPAASREHTVVVPIYNAYDEVKACVESVLEYSGERTKILLINDASTDARIGPMLNEYAKADPRVEVVQNEENLGFTRSVNLGAQRATGDVILLNSDTEVTPRWLDKLEDAAYSREGVATVTPLTNTGSAFAVPRNNAVNELPDFLTPEMVNAAVEGLSERLRPEAPTGNGFCLYIRREALEAVGPFDEEAFPRGYGEENDFCLRATQQGFVHLIDDATFVYHKEGASFLQDKQPLIEAGLKTINERYPGYDRLIQDWLRHDELAVLRSELESIWNAWSPLPVESALAGDRRKTILHVVHEGTGGTLYHVDDLASSVWHRYRCLRLETGGRRWRLSVYTGRAFEKVEDCSFAARWQLVEGLDGPRSEALNRLLERYSPDLVHVHHLLGSAPELIERCRAIGARVIYSFHDFYALCPSFNLLDDRNTFCSGYCTPGAGTCRVHIDWARYPNLKHDYVHTWRRDRVARALGGCDRLVSFSNSVRDLVVEHFPNLDTEDYVVIPHGEDLSDMRRVADPPGQPPTRVLLLGGLSVSKGVELVERLVRTNQERNGPFEFHFVGNITPGYAPDRYGAVMHGPYQRENLPEILAAIRPSFALIASPWPETFCYTLSECWAAGLPVLAADLGTQKERVEATGGGWLLDPSDPEAWYDTLLQLANDSEAYRACAERVQRISLKTLAQMKQDYIHLYESVLGERAEFADSPVGVVAAD